MVTVNFEERICACCVIEVFVAAVQVLLFLMSCGVQQWEQSRRVEDVGQTNSMASTAKSYDVNSLLKMDVFVVIYHERVCRVVASSHTNVHQP